MRLGAFGLDEIRTNQYYYSAIGYLYEMAHLPPLLGGKIYAAGWYEAGKAFQVPEFRHLNSTGSAGVAIDAFWGPLFLGGSAGESGRHKIYFFLGKLF